MSELSLAAQAVLDAAYQEMDYAPRRHVQWVTAAALRAAAEQVVPEEPLEGGDLRWIFERDARQACRKKLLAIAVELEAQ